jgi:hypothetical protein
MGTLKEHACKINIFKKILFHKYNFAIMLDFTKSLAII